MGMSFRKKVVWVFGAGFLGMLFLSGLYIGIVSLAESPQHAAILFWEDRWIILPILFGFGVQSSLYIILKKRMYIAFSPSLSLNTGPTGAIAGASGTTSTLAMIACCAHHVTDVLPVLGLTTTAAFLGRYQIQLMRVGLGMTYLGIGIMLVILIRERRKAFEHMHRCTALSNMEVL